MPRKKKETTLETGILGGQSAPSLLIPQAPLPPTRPARRVIQAILFGPTHSGFATSDLIPEPFILHELFVSVSTLAATPDLHDARIIPAFTPDPGNDSAALQSGQPILGGKLVAGGIPCGFNLHLTNLFSYWPEGNQYLCFLGFTASLTNFDVMAALAVISPLEG
jgi:hypothetical protein